MHNGYTKDNSIEKRIGKTERNENGKLDRRKRNENNIR